MIRFKEFFFEATKRKGKVIAFGRVNPVTPGHVKLFDTVRDIADKQGDDHEVILSGSQDPKKNPLSPKQKLAHARAASPATNITAASHKMPTILHHAAHAHAQGYNHLTVVAGEDRVPEFQQLFDRYNGVQPKKEGQPFFHFKNIKVVSAGHRDPDAEGVEGISASKQRDHAVNGRKQEFMSGVPQGVDGDKLYHELRAGMGIND